MRAKRIGSISNVKNLTGIAMLASISSILMFFDFALPIFPGFLKIDFSDLPALIGTFAFGPVGGVFIELLKSLIHLLRTSTGGVGELATFIIGGSFTLVAGLVYNWKRTKSGALLAMFLGILAMTVAAIFANLYILIPFYTRFMPLEKIISISARFIKSIDSLEKVVLYSVAPFNILKGFLVSFVTWFIYKKLRFFID